MKITYTTQGTCSKLIEAEVEDGIVKEVTFYGGCTVICRVFPPW